MSLLFLFLDLGEQDAKRKKQMCGGQVVASTSSQPIKILILYKCIRITCSLDHFHELVVEIVKG